MLAADEPDSHGVEWLSHKDRYGGKRNPPRSLAHLKREFSKAKWTDARKWAKAPSDKPDPTVARVNKRLDSRFYQLKIGYCLTGQYLQWTTSLKARRQMLVVPVQDPDPRASLQEPPG